MLIGGIEAGGTKIVCAVGDRSGEIKAKQSISTRDPDETLQEVKAFFSDYELESLGVGSFGPINLNKNSDTYGMILNTPKTAWKHFDLLGRLQQDFRIPIFIDTDVNAACLSEYRHGAGKDVNSCLYITVGTGIGAGLVQEGRTFQGRTHPEMGHVIVPQHPDDTFPGVCPYHGNCLEGMASGPAIEKRHGRKGHLLADDVNVWEIEAHYLAHAIASYTLILSPERIILGGGVMKQDVLFPLVRQKVFGLVNDYVDMGNMNEFIVTPELGDEQGVKGAIALTVSEK
ncbi:ROK family protein [Lentibacillus amyloliquefaciens]|uniref:fructokinase n=1 Tax=Lentibacillus amyloliquefaciens TaxID=1472767 RepID=A0A0U3WJY7_9BACI|nr:ROK family protein [Lentibacillus amyloliquefaciens]ALX50127.1 fructokinase [Lentibacillus amyloliquefaciens]